MIKHIFTINHNKYFYLWINWNSKILIWWHLSAFHVQQFLTAQHWFESKRGRVGSTLSLQSIALLWQLQPLYHCFLSLICCKKGNTESVVILGCKCPGRLLNYSVRRRKCCTCPCPRQERWCSKVKNNCVELDNFHRAILWKKLFLSSYLLL